MRVKNSIKNIYISILTQIIVILLGFVSRKVFIDSLGSEYLGINGLLTNVLSMLSLVEGGVGASIVYNLYKPLAEDDRPKIIALVQLYKKIYWILAIVVFILGMSLYPFLGLFVKDTNIKFLFLVYLIFVTKNFISYLNAHKWSLINADQKGYVLARYNLLFNVVTTISRIFILKFTNNYILYLLIELVIIVIQNIWNGRIVDIRYPYIKEKKKYSVDAEVKENLKTNVKAIFLHNIGSYCVFGTDNLLISALVNLKSVGLYSNYTMITTQLGALINPIINGIGASVGNLIATEDDTKTYEIFNVTYLINFWIYSFAVIFLYNLLEPFIDFWLGEGLLLGKITFILILVNFYLSGLRKSVCIFKEKAGIFAEDKYVPIFESIINLGASIILGKRMGLSGIFLGTTISTVALPLWIQAKFVYNKVFKKSVSIYFVKYIVYIFITLIVGGISTILCNTLVQFDGFFSLVLKGLICVIVTNLIYILLFYKTKEFQYIKSIVVNMIENKFKNNNSNKVDINKNSSLG